MAARARRPRCATDGRYGMYRETAGGGEGVPAAVRPAWPGVSMPAAYSMQGETAAQRPVRHASGTPLPPLALFARASQPPRCLLGKAAAAPQGARMTAPSRDS